MSRTGGVYSAPAGTKATPNTPIESAKYNAFVDDLVADANNARPITAGGTGGNSAVKGNDGLNTQAANMASGSTVNLANATGVVVNITGTTTITALGTVAAGAERVLIFAGALTLTHNDTSLILPGAANITTAAGDVATMRSLGSGNWRCVSYQRANGQPVNTMFDAASFTTSITVSKMDDGAGPDPSVVLERISASPAALDWLGSYEYYGRDSAGNTQSYASSLGYIVDPTSGAEAGGILFGTQHAGTWQTRLRIERGLLVGNPTGNDKGVGTINVDTAYYANGARLGGAPDAVLQNKQTSGAGGDNATTSFAKLTINTEVRDPANQVTLSSSQMTFASDGWLEWEQEGFAVGIKTKLRNVTDSTDVFGSYGIADAGPNTGTKSTGGAPIIAGKVYELQGRASGSRTNGFGLASSMGDEVYTQIKFWRTT